MDVWQGRAHTGLGGRAGCPHGQTVCVDRVSGHDLWQADDLTVAARPVLWHGRVAKIALIAVPYRDRSVLQPQVWRASFQRIAEAYQVI